MASNISKVIYFDESSALDFLDLLNDGRLITSLEEISSVEDSAEINHFTNIACHIIPPIFPIFYL